MNLQSALSSLLHLAFPQVCTGCGSDLVSAKHQLCLHCLDELPVTNFFSQPGNPVEKIFYGRLTVQNAGATFFFTKDSLIQNLVFSLKYRGNKEIGTYLGKMTGYNLAADGRFSNVDVIVPLPLNLKREKKRGYNQALAICNGIASVWQKPVLAQSVVRKINTETQTKKGRVNRWTNMDGVFAVTNTEVLRNKHILLVDDVVTTGASLEACGTEILKVPGTTLSIATLAYTI